MSLRYPSRISHIGYVMNVLRMGCLIKLFGVILGEENNSVILLQTPSLQKKKESSPIHFLIYLDLVFSKKC